MKPVTPGVALILAMAVMAGCGGDVSGGHGSPSPQAARATPDARAHRMCRAGGPVDALTALGATFTAWQAHHEPDPEGRVGSFGPIQNDGLDRYTSVMCTAEQRVVSYHLNFVPGLSLADAMAAARQELPVDAVARSDTKLAFCEVLDYQSQILAGALPKDDGPGAVRVTLLGAPGTQISLLDLVAAPPATPASGC